MVKDWYKSKTLWIGVLQIVIGVLGLVATFLQDGMFTPEAYVLLVTGALTIIMRWMTNTAIQ